MDGESAVNEPLNSVGVFEFARLGEGEMWSTARKMDGSKQERPTRARSEGGEGFIEEVEDAQGRGIRGEGRREQRRRRVGDEGEEKVQREGHRGRGTATVRYAAHGGASGLVGRWWSRIPTALEG